ncbi:MAG: hypothetical protein AABW92_02370 [Nanoarchaeota archaeon]
MKLIKKIKSKYSKVEGIKLNSPLITRLLIVFIGLIVLSIFVNIKLISFLVIITGFNAWLAGFQLRRGIPTDLELSTFATVLTTIAFGFKWGIFIAIFSKLFASISTGDLKADHFFMILTYIIAAIITALFKDVNVFGLGMIIISLNAVIMFLVSKSLLGLDPTSNLSYTGTNFIFNFLVFSIFSEIVLAILR